MEQIPDEVALNGRGHRLASRQKRAGGWPNEGLVRLHPVASGGAQFEIADPRPQAVTFSVRITDVVDDDNGCNPAERRVGVVEAVCPI